jgi:hypothetical protein
MLQNMESFRGLAILTPNTRSALDPGVPAPATGGGHLPLPGQGGAVDPQAWRSRPQRRWTSWTGAAGTVDHPGGGIAAAALTTADLGAEAGMLDPNQVILAPPWGAGQERPNPRRALTAPVAPT